MKQFTATFWRGNPQLKNGGYETTRNIEAKSISSAKSKAQKIENSCVYGTMKFLEIKEVS